MHWENHLEKTAIIKIKKVKTEDKLPHLNKKNHNRLSELLYKHRFLSLLEKSTGKFHAANRLTFPLNFLFQRYRNHYSNFTSKIMKMCEQILKKTAPQYNPIIGL